MGSQQHPRVMASALTWRETRPRKLCEIVADHLRGMIVRRELLEGDSLPTEAVLIETMKVSRPSLREGLRILESEGLISIKAGTRSGAQVRRPSSASAATQLGWLLQFEQCSSAEITAARTALTGSITLPVIAVLDRLLSQVCDDVAAIESGAVRQ